MEEQIKCPKCGSTQLTTNEKGFSGGKAVAGAILTGGVGLLAGLHGKNKIIITCLACGNNFKPGEGIISTPDGEQKTPQKKEGCFIATACYGSYYADEVFAFRQFRDDVLLKTFIGNFFVKVYYFTSPPFARFISRSEILKKTIRLSLLSPLLYLIIKNKKV